MKRAGWTVVALAGALMMARVAGAQPQITSQKDAASAVTMEVGETRLVQLSAKITRVSVADPNVADIRVVTPLQVMITGKAVGYTHIILWGEDDQPLVMAVSCRRNLNELRGQLKDLFPGEEINVSAAGDLVVLSGRVSDLRLPSRVAEVAKLHTERLANLVEVSGNQQVQLEVRFAEVSRTGLRKMGFNHYLQETGIGQVMGSVVPGVSPNQHLVDRPGPVFGTPQLSPLVYAPAHGDAFNIFYSATLGNFGLNTIMSIMAEEGLAKVLAEPTLVALSGQKAAFHAGGEVPIVISQQLGSATVQYKKFGVRLEFTPTVLGERSVNLNVMAEVSELDPSAGVVLTGYQIPGFKTRNGETTIRLKDGQSFAMAGLLSDSVRSAVKKVPLLGDIPVLGALFRSTGFQREETELLVVVTAHLVQPLMPDQVPALPGENDLNDPDDMSLFLLGKIDGWTKESRDESSDNPSPAAKDERSGAAGEEGPSPASGGGPTGPIGFIR